ncbi:MAG TPA: hypothetical protein ENH84_02160 [Phycisphaerae bacterium]|nr:hypothetical protein [Phycisphaerae bacterium]
MAEQNVNNFAKAPEPDNRDSQAKAGPAFSCCGEEATEAVTECPCASFFKKHTLAAVGIFSVMLLMFLISQVGGILGIIAFIRTL